MLNKRKTFTRKNYLIIVFLVLIIEIKYNIRTDEKTKKNEIKTKKIEVNFENNYVKGDFFKSLADNKTIYYSKTDYVRTAFKTTNYYKILITHNSDYPITEELFRDFLKCNKFKFWFAQNIKFKHSRLYSLPIGIENSYWSKFSKYNVIMEEIKKNIKPKKLLFASFSIITNREKRTNCINSFKNKNYLTNKVAYKLKSVSDVTIEEYRNFADEVLSHQFTLCPEGNGIDTHRFWEVLYLKRFPVVLRNLVTESFNDLPVLILNKWSDFEEEYENFLRRVEKKEFKYDKLNPEYWRKLLMTIN